MAEAISFATSGVIPIPLVKMIICLGIVAAETAVDISYLKAGLPVLFIKTDEDLFLTLDGLITETSSGISGFKNNGEKACTNNRPCFAYSNYLYTFLMIANTANFLLSQSKVYFELKADIKVSPLMLGIPFSREEGADILDASSWNSFTYSGIRGY